MQTLIRKGLTYMTQHKYDATRRDLVLYRIETAKEDLDAAKLLLAAKVYKSANNRAYYAIFHSVSAVHALDGRAYKAGGRILLPAP